jgi:hypothetical protein
VAFNDPFGIYIVALQVSCGCLRPGRLLRGLGIRCLRKYARTKTICADHDEYTAESNNP